MREISWEFNKSIGYYDIVNKFTSPGDEGNLEVIESKILIKLNTFQGEWSQDPLFGIPLVMSNVDTSDPNAYLQVLVNELLEIEGVDSVNVDDFEYQGNDRLFKANFKVSTKFGKISIGV